VAINGPVALPDGSGMLVTEILRNRVWKFDHNDNASILLDNSNGTLCLAFDSKGRLIGNQTMPPERNKIAVIFPKGQETVLADDFEDKPFGRPNDLVVDKKGGVYFTDPGPNAGQIRLGHPATQPAVYYVPAGGRTIKVADGIERPNGIQLSPDESILYLSDSLGDSVLAFDVQADGTLRNRRDFARLEHGRESDADGLGMDNDGRLYVSVRGGVQIFSPQGQHLGTIPSGGPGNVAFGGRDKKTLYITSGTSLTKVQMLAQGFAGRAK
jgi:gluconolactonase